MRGLRTAGWAAALLALAGLPGWINDNYILHLLILAGIFTLLASGLNLISGYVGELSLAHAGFFGVGAYTSVLLTMQGGASFWTGMVGAGLLAALAGLGIGMVSLRLRGAYFIIVTFSFAEILRIVANNWMSLTRGPLGLVGIPEPVLALPGLGRVEIYSKPAFYYVILALVVLTQLCLWALVRSRVGRTWVAIRENEALAVALGVHTYRYATLAFVVGAFFAGIAGSFYAHYIGVVTPEVLGFGHMVSMLLMMVIGGKGTLGGPVLGALLITVLPEYLRMAKMYQLPIFGVLLIIMMLYQPEGLWGLGLHLRERVRRWRAAAVRLSAGGVAGDA